ncbi:MAG: glycosyltransferase family 2 protein [Candidatus Zixiibacteriota bacterium]
MRSESVDLRYYGVCVVDVCIVIPAFNAAPAISSVIERIHRVADHAGVIVVDDGSTDDTLQIADRSGVRVIAHGTNRGKGAALRTGIAAALDSGADAIIQMDADGQHEADSIPEFIRALEGGEGDIIIGARSFRRGVMPFHRRMSNTITSWMLSRLCGVHIPDSQSGYRILARRVAEEVKPRSNGFDFESEYIILATRLGFRIGSIPIATVYGAEDSSIRGWRDTFRFIRLMGLFWNNRSDKHLQDA